MYPNFDEFQSLARKFPVVPVSIECLSDELTPLSLFHALYKKSKTCFLLESVEGGEHLGRYSFVASDFHQIIRSYGKKIVLESSKQKKTYVSERPFEEIQKILRNYKAPHLNGLPRFYGGAVGHINYDMVRHFEKIPNTNQDVLRLPESFLMLTRDMFVFDHVGQSVRLIRNLQIPKGISLSKLYKKTAEELKKKIKYIRPSTTPLKPFALPPKTKLPFKKEDKLSYKKKVEKAKRYIESGDIIQVVPSRRFSFNIKSHPLEIYRILRRINPSPYLYFLRDGKNHVIGSSPEMLVRLEDGMAETRPIAGTRPRHLDPLIEKEIEREFLKDEKERAEHLMLVDLSRNDLGRVCQSGSVQVSDFMSIERYSHVLHMVSKVTGCLNKSKDAFDLFKATFPAGTLTGAPKIRAMEIIEELEKTRRGVYGGAVGYFSYTGNMDMAITIRTILLQGKKAHIQAGGGIVADSNPEHEFQETQNKAAAMIRTLQAAEMNL